MKPEITRNIPIGELVLNYPESVEVLFSHGFHCIGCGLSAYETLEQGASAHGFDDAMIDGIIVELKEAAKKAESAGLVRKCEPEGAAAKKKKSQSSRTTKT